MAAVEHMGSRCLLLAEGAGAVKLGTAVRQEQGANESATTALQPLAGGTLGVVFKSNCVLTLTSFCLRLCVCYSTGAPRAIEGSGDDGPLLCQRLLLASDQSTEVLLDPSTYGYQGCSCKSPFKAVATSHNGATTSLRCVVNQVGSAAVADADVVAAAVVCAACLPPSLLISAAQALL